MKLDQDMMELGVMINQVGFAQKARGNHKNILFNNNKNNKITKEYLKKIEYFNLYFMLHIIENIEIHVLTIRLYHYILSDLQITETSNMKLKI